MQGTCGYCNHYVAQNNEANKPLDPGQCRRYPPIAIAGQSLGVWPSVTPHETCGEYVSKPRD